MNIQGFRAAADRPNAVLAVDLKSAEVRVRNNHVLNRAITWLRRRLSPNPSRDAAMDAAHNRFLQAIADRRSGYDSSDVNRARDLLAGDVLERKPLSSRRIREVLDDLDGRSSATTRINRRVATYFHEQTGTTNTLAARDLAANSRDEQRSEAEFVAPGEVDAEPQNPARTSEAGNVRESVDAQTLVRPPPAESTENAALPETVNAPAPDARPGVQLQPAKAEAETAARESASPKRLARELAKAKLPGDVAKHLKRLIAAGNIVDSKSLAKQGNERTAQWVAENRVGRWYVEALKDRGVRRQAQREGTVSVPSSLLSAVARSIADSPALKNYPDIKAHSRHLIALHIKQEVEPRP